MPAGTEFGGTVESTKPEYFGQGVKFVTATPDLSHFVLTSSVSLLEGVPSSVGKQSLYIWSEGHIVLASLIPPGSQSSCGGTGPACVPAIEEGFIASVGDYGYERTRNAISADGQRLIYEAVTGHQHALYLSDPARGEAVRLDATQPGAEGGVSEPVYQTASADGSRVFFTDKSRLTEGSTASGAPDLYMCQIVEAAGHLACELRDLSVDHNHGEAANVLGDAIGAAEDGSSVYFVADGALAEGAVHGDCLPGTELPPSQSCNLYRYDVEGEETQLVAVLSGADGHDWDAGSSQDLGGMTSRVSPNGRYLAFMSQRPLTGYDNRDAATGQPDQEVFLYDAAANGGAGELVAPPATRAALARGGSKTPQHSPACWSTVPTSGASRGKTAARPSPPRSPAGPGSTSPTPLPIPLPLRLRPPLLQHRRRPLPGTPTAPRTSMSTSRRGWAAAAKGARASRPVTVAASA